MDKIKTTCSKYGTKVKSVSRCPHYRQVRVALSPVRNGGILIEEGTMTKEEGQAIENAKDMFRLADDPVSFGAVNFMVKFAIWCIAQDRKGGEIR